MHPRIAELIAYIEAETAKLKQAYEAVPPERRAERHAPDRWSAAEVVHHLAIVERRLALRMAAFVEQLRAVPPETDVSPVLPTINTARTVDRTRRFVTSEAGTPKANDAETAWSDLENARRALIAAILSGDGLAFGTVSAPHPALGNLSGYEWIAFAGAHAARHADQIREMTTT
jgi:hypothetical protein